MLFDKQNIKLYESNDVTKNVPASLQKASNVAGFRIVDAI